MKPLKSLLTSIAFALAGVAVHGNAATENHRNSSGICFQTTPLDRKKASAQWRAAGASDSPQER